MRECSKCGGEVITIRRYNREILCGKCFEEIPPINSFGGNFYTSKDKLWEFTSIHVTGQPVEIRGKSQWRRFLKEHNKHDDTSKKDMEVVQRNHERNLRETSKRNIHEAVEDAYRWAKHR